MRELILQLLDDFWISPKMDSPMAFRRAVLFRGRSRTSILTERKRAPHSEMRDPPMYSQPPDVRLILLMNACIWSALSRFI